MAVDKAIDSTQLDADLESVADAIRTKGGTSAQLAFPAGFVSAIDAIPTGGGGGEVYTGTVELTNEELTEFYIPVDVSDATHFEVVAYCDRTGTVSGGVVAYDAEPIVSTLYTSSNPFIWYYAAREFIPARQMKRDDNNYASNNNPQNVSYCHTYRGNNGTRLGLNYDVVSGTRIKINASNAARRFCRAGLYSRFVYTVVKY